MLAIMTADAGLSPRSGAAAIRMALTERARTGTVPATPGGAKEALVGDKSPKKQSSKKVGKTLKEKRESKRAKKDQTRKPLSSS
jgi:hypothetical protein